jgi:hypothetical protein
MATFLFSGLLVAFAGGAAQGDSVRAVWWARVAADSTDGRAWLGLGKSYLRLAADYHTHRAAPDSLRARATLDTAEQTLVRAVRWNAGTRAADSAQLFLAFSYGERAYLDWELHGQGAAVSAWHRLPEAVRLPPVLEELGENLLRACPRGGILFTANDIDTQTAWYLRFVRGLRTDLIIVPFERWRADAVFRGQVVREMKIRDASLRALGETRALCASMAFERPPEVRPAVKWNKRPLVWVAGRESKADRVPAQDFAFAALRLALDQHETWTQPAVAIYRRAASHVSALCRASATFGVKAEVGCR